MILIKHVDGLILEEEKERDNGLVGVEGCIMFIIIVIVIVIVDVDVDVDIDIDI